MVSAEFQIGRRLALARGILEAPEHVPDFDKDGLLHPPTGGWSHVRHDWESVCVYLLLTCFDLMGQNGEHKPFQDWLVSNRAEHKKQRAEARASILSPADEFETSHQLYQFYNRLFGVKTAFNRGIDSLKESARRSLLDSIDVAFQRDYDPNVSKRAEPVDWSPEKLDIKRREFIFQQRNRFTHRLEGTIAMSGPSPGVWNGEKIGSYLAYIHDDNEFFGICYQHSIFANGGRDRYVYTIRGWPFLLMEILYAHIKQPFSRYDLKLSVQVTVSSSASAKVLRFPNVPFAMLANPQAFRDRLLEERP